MPRRANRPSTGVNLDSLMDTLTNVVGILMIILILVQLNAGQALRQIISELPEVSVEEFEQIQEEAQEVEEEYEEQKEYVEQVREEHARNSEELSELMPQLTAVETALEESDIPLLDVDTIREELEEKRKELAEKRESVNEMIKEEQRLRALLEDTPDVDPPAPETVRLPASRPLPENAVLQRYLVYDGLVYHMDMDAAMEEVIREWRNVRSRMEHERADGQVIYDQERLAEHLNRRIDRVGNADVEILNHPRWDRLRLEITPSEGRGAAVETAGDMLSPFRSEIQRYRGTNNVVWFLVMPDQFREYLRLREICDDLGLNVGWEVVNNPRMRRTITEFRVNRLEEPPPPSPRPTPDPDEIRIPAPTRQLD